MGKTLIVVLILLSSALSTSAQTQADVKQLKEGYSITMLEIQYMSLLMDKNVTEAGKGEFHTLFITNEWDYSQYAVFTPKKSCVIKYHNNNETTSIQVTSGMTDNIIIIREWEHDKKGKKYISIE